MFTIALTLYDEDIEKLASLRNIKNSYDAITATFVAFCDNEIEDNGILYLDELKDISPDGYKALLASIAALSRPLLLKQRND